MGQSRHAREPVYTKQHEFCVNKMGCGRVLDFIGVPYQP